MPDVLQLDDQFPILADAQRVAGPLRVLKHGDTFSVFDEHGDVIGEEAEEQGLYYHGTRFLSTKGHMGFREKTADGEQKSAEQLIGQELKKEFSPEFINRIDDIIIFNPLTRIELRQICQLLVDDVNHALIHRNVQIGVDESVIDWLLKKAEEEANSGARPLRRSIQRYIEDELSEFMIRHKDSVPERIDFTMNGAEVLLMPRAIEELTQ